MPLKRAAAPHGFVGREDQPHRAGAEHGRASHRLMCSPGQVESGLLRFAERAADRRPPVGPTMQGPSREAEWDVRHPDSSAVG